MRNLFIGVLLDSLVLTLKDSLFGLSVLEHPLFDLREDLAVSEAESDLVVEALFESGEGEHLAGS